MKKIKDFITEKQNFLVTNKNALKNYDEYEYHPQTYDELKYIIIDLLKKGITDLNCIDVSDITDMRFIFHDVNNIVKVNEIDISEWDVSNVTDMAGMFWDCNNLNVNISKWNVSKVTKMNSMFWNCHKFNCDLSNWDVSNVTDMRAMFDKCTTLKKNNKIPKWYNCKV